MLLFQFARRPVIHVVPDIFFIRKNLMHGHPVPLPSEVCHHALCVQNCGDFRFGFSFGDERMINPAHDFDLLFRPGHQHHAVGLDAFLLTHFQQRFPRAALINQHPPQTEPGRSALFEPKLNQPARTLENFR